MRKHQHKLPWTLIFLFLFLVVFPNFFTLYGDFLWFDMLGFKQVFMTLLSTKVMLFFGGTILAAIALYANYKYTVHSISTQNKKYHPTAYPIYIIGFLSVLIGSMVSGQWRTFLEYAHRVPFNVTDPIFNLDLGFFVFELPLYEMLTQNVLFLASCAILMSFVLYIFAYGVGKEQRMDDTTIIEVEAFNFSKGLGNLTKKTVGHFSVLLSAFFFLYGLSVYFSRYEILYGHRGAVFGAGFVDATIAIPLLSIIAGLAALGGVLALINAKLHKHKLLLFIVVGIFGLLFVQGIIAGAAQRFIVQPDEFNKEKPYLQYNIDMTRQAYNLDKISEEEFPVTGELTKEKLEQNPETMQNVRLWDYRPLETTYNQIQIFRSYYNFKDVDIDRYDFGDRREVVMLSAREIDTSALPSQSQTWVNNHLVYTHGYGIAMSPVSQISKQGLPELYVKDIPPKADVPLEIEKPGIYFGESTNDYALVKTETEELDYPSGDDNVYTSYEGRAGVKLDTFLKRLTYAVVFGDINLIISDSLTPESKLLMYRNIHERVRRVAPFFDYDRDPYIVVADGRLQWLYDAYTVTDRYPYSEGFRFGGRNINYIRNAIKVSIDAYDGHLRYFIADDTDPLVNVYSSIFPELFLPLSQMSEDLAAHIRYPEDIFTVQAAMYLDYHMRDPRVFYNKEDQWRFPDEILRGRKTAMEPYYIIMKLPGEEKEEFVQVLPFIPVGRDNMIAWIAARSDMPHYGELKTYLFSKQSLAFGPMQIESKIDQDTFISERITLWSQSGSDVIRGNLLAIPIENNILYVEPLFLEATTESSLPELRRVIVAYEDRVVMKPTFEEAIDALFGIDSQTVADLEERVAQEQSVSETPSTTVTQPGQTLAEQALAAYKVAKETLKTGDLVGYAQRMEEVGRLLEKMQE